MSDIDDARSKRGQKAAQDAVDEATKQIDENFVWKDEFEEILHHLYNHLINQNIGLAKLAIKDALSAFGCDPVVDEE